MTKLIYIKSNLLIQYKIYFHLIIKIITKYLNSMYMKLNESYYQGKKIIITIHKSRKKKIEILAIFSDPFSL